MLNLKNFNETLKAEAADYDPRFHTELEAIVHTDDLGKFAAFFSNKLQSRESKLSEILFSLIKILHTISLPILEKANEIILSFKGLSAVKVETLNIYLNKLASSHSKKLAARTFQKMMRFPSSPVILLTPSYLFEHLEDSFENSQDDVAGITHLKSQLVFALDFLEELSEARHRDSATKQSEYIRYLNTNILSRITQKLISHGGLTTELKEAVDAVLERYYRTLTKQFFAGLPEVADFDLWTPQSFIDYFIFFAAEVDHHSRTVLLNNPKLIQAAEVIGQFSDKMQLQIIDCLVAIFKTGVSNHPLSIEYRFTAKDRELMTALEGSNNRLMSNLSKLLVAATARFSGMPVHHKRPTGQQQVDAFIFDTIVYGLLTEEAQSHNKVASDLKILGSTLLPNRFDGGRGNFSPFANYELYQDVILPTLAGMYEAANRAMNQNYLGQVISDVMYKKIYAYFDFMLMQVNSSEFSGLRGFRALQRVQDVLRGIHGVREWGRLYDGSVTLNFKDKRIQNQIIEQRVTEKEAFFKLVRDPELLELNYKLNSFMYKPRKNKSNQSKEASGELPDSNATPNPDAPKNPDTADNTEIAKTNADGKKSGRSPAKKYSKSIETPMFTSYFRFSSTEPERLSYKLFLDSTRGEQLLDHYLENITPEIFKGLNITYSDDFLRLAHFMLDIAIKTQSVELLVHGERLCGLLSVQLIPEQREKYLSFKALVAAHTGRRDSPRPRPEVHGRDRRSQGLHRPLLREQRLRTGTPDSHAWLQQAHAHLRGRCQCEAQRA